MDCAVREDVTIEPKTIGYALLNISVKPPKGHYVIMAARSSLHKRGLMFANGIGILDEDYCGDNDEYRAILFNFTDEQVELKRGDRISQIIVMPYDKVHWNEVETLGEPDRGGIGSTGI
jgi:dUTP pyrophosphatase